MDLVNRRVSSRWRKVDNDSAEVTLSSRSFHVCGPTSGKARLVGDGCQLNRRHCQTVPAVMGFVGVKNQTAVERLRPKIAASAELPCNSKNNL